MVIAILITILLGLVLAIILVRNNYKPINDILSIIQGTQDISTENELNVIKKSFANISNDLNNKQKIIDTQKKSLFYNFIADALMGYVNNINEFYSEFENYEIKLISDKFCVMIFKIEDFGDVLVNEKTDKAEWATIKFAMRNIIEELVCEKHLGFVCSVEHMICCLVNYNEGYIFIIRFNKTYKLGHILFCV